MTAEGWFSNAQGVFFNLYFFFYLLSPKHCHAFIGYLEEEAVKTCEPPSFNKNA